MLTVNKFNRIILYILNIIHIFIVDYMNYKPSRSNNIQNYILIKFLIFILTMLIN